MSYSFQRVDPTGRVASFSSRKQIWSDIYTNSTFSSPTEILTIFALGSGFWSWVLPLESVVARGSRVNDRSNGSLYIKKLFLKSGKNFTDKTLVFGLNVISQLIETIQFLLPMCCNSRQRSEPSRTQPISYN